MTNAQLSKTSQPMLDNDTFTQRLPPRIARLMNPSFLNQMLAILSDAPLVHFRRSLGKLIDAEQGHGETRSATA